MNSLANELGQYFTTKVETIRSQLNSVDTQHTSIPSSTITCQLMDFDPLSEEDVQKSILDTAKKSCLLGSMPTSLMLECCLLPVIASLNKFVFRIWPICCCVQTGHWLAFAIRC